jgi:2-C-methyl-D-erythritol 4-phosphate cytidylyltransferase
MSEPANQTGLEVSQDARVHDASVSEQVDSVWCVLLAGGSGQRFGSLKQFDSLAGARVIDHAARTAAAACDGVVAVLPAASLATADGTVAAATAVVAGGDSRSESVRAGLAAIPAKATVILVHDAARPLASVELFERVIAAVRADAPAVVPAVRVVDTIRSVGPIAPSSASADSAVVGVSAVVDRDQLRAVQTPQGFRADLLRRAYEGDGQATDDAGLVEALGQPIILIEGERSNLKLTETADRIIAEALLASLQSTTPTEQG